MQKQNKNTQFNNITERNLMVSWTEPQKNTFSKKIKFFTTIIYNPLHLRLPLYRLHHLHEYTMPLANLLIIKSEILIRMVVTILSRSIVILFFSSIDYCTIYRFVFL